MYTDFIKNKLLPELTLLATKYATWWTFKPDSLLKSYLDDREINLDKYFRPQELLKHVLNVLKKETQFSNNNVIVLMDEEQQRVFDSWFNNKHFFTRHSETIIGINDNTSITNLFDFRYFHISQIENILKQITKFLGRKNNMIKNCHFLKHNQSFKVASNNKYTNVFNFIDDVINNNNDLMPHILSGLSI